MINPELLNYFMNLRFPQTQIEHAMLYGADTIEKISNLLYNPRNHTLAKSQFINDFSQLEKLITDNYVDITDIPVIDRPIYFIVSFLAGIAYTRPRFLLKIIKYLQNYDISSILNENHSSPIVKLLVESIKQTDDIDKYKVYFKFSDDDFFNYFIEFINREGDTEFDPGIFDSKFSTCKIDHIDLYGDNFHNMELPLVYLLFEEDILVNYYKNSILQSEELKLVAQMIPNKSIRNIIQEKELVKINHLSNHLEFLTIYHATDIQPELQINILVRLSYITGLMNQNYLLFNYEYKIFSDAFNLKNELIFHVFQNSKFITKFIKTNKITEDIFTKDFPESMKIMVSSYLENLSNVIDKTKTNFTVGNNALYISYRKQFLTFSDGRQTRGRKLQTDISELFTFDQVFDFVGKLTSSFCINNQTLIENSSKNLYGISFDIIDKYTNQKVFRLKSIDNYKSFTIIMYEKHHDIAFKYESSKHFLMTPTVEPQLSEIKKLTGRMFKDALKRKIIDYQFFNKYCPNWDPDSPKKTNNDLSEILNSLQGHFYVHHSEKEEPLKFNGNNIEYCIFRSPYAKQIIENAQAIELDATFSLDGYITISPHCIIHNIGYPIGLYIGKSENELAYELAYKNIFQVADNDIKNIPFINDFGKGLCSFLTKHKFKIYYCLRHYLNRLGANSSLCVIAQHILFSENLDEYSKRLNRYMPIIQLQYEKNIITNAQFKAFCELKTNKKELAVCLREPRITCSNHIESYHSHIAKLIKNFASPNEKVEAILQYIIQRGYEAHNPKKECALQEYRRVKQRYDEIIEMNKAIGKSSDYLNCKTAICPKCDRKITIKKWGVYIPCIHVISHYNAEDIETPEGINLSEDEKKPVVITVLNQPNPKGPEEKRENPQVISMPSDIIRADFKDGYELIHMVALMLKISFFQAYFIVVDKCNIILYDGKKDINYAQFIYDALEKVSKFVRQNKDQFKDVVEGA